jgi:glycine cleavage system H protein
MAYPTDRVYSSSHEWHKTDGDTITLGLTSFAVDQLTDVTFVEIKPVGTQLSSGDSLGEVESVKTTSDVYSAVSGTISEVNQSVIDNPALLNEDAHGAAWLVKIKVSDASGLSSCVDAQTYASEHAH